VLHLGLNNFNECPLSPLVTSDSWKKFTRVHVFFSCNYLDLEKHVHRSNVFRRIWR